MTLRAWAPGRVNLIGEHTDYNAGLCLPVALGVGTTVAARPRSDGLVHLSSSATDQTWTGRPSEAGPGSVEGWAGYAAGVLWALEQAGHEVPGLDLAVHSTVPLGAGLSSSASLEAAVGVAAWVAGERELDAVARQTLVAACTRAESDVVGAPTGGLDQRAVLETLDGHALLIDFASGAAEHVAVPLAEHRLALLVIDTRVTHALVSGDYGSRREECAQAALALNLENLSLATEQDVARITDPVLRRRARHVVTENERVRSAVAALRGHDWAALGTLMSDSHSSMRDDFEISCPELDTAVDAARGAGALGARMTGGGFGGSAVALVPDSAASQVRQAVDAAFADRGFRAPHHLDGSPHGPAKLLTS